MKNTEKQPPLSEDLKYLQDTLYVIGGKWTLPILLALQKGHRHFKAIQKNIPGITPRMLSKELRDLELNKIIIRKPDDDNPAKADYEVTAYCDSFDPIIQLLIDWGKQHRQIIRTSA